jgi:MFS family permease
LDAPVASQNITVANAAWRSPRNWLRRQNLGREYWIFFSAAFCFDAGFSIYFFLFNLFLLDVHYDERAIGLIAGAFTLGSVAGTLPAGAVARRFGTRPMLIGCFLAAPVLGALRAVWIWEPAQLACAFLAGVAMCGWGVGYLPAVAGLTTTENRTAGYSLIYSVSVATGALGALLCGALPHLLTHAGIALSAVNIKRLILIGSCAVAAAGLFAVVRLPTPQSDPGREEPFTAKPRQSWLAAFRLNPFLLRFLPAMALWAVVLASFTPFANVYLSRDLHIPLARIGIIFAAAQALQVCAGLLTPFVFRVFGPIRGIVITQLAPAFALGLLAVSTSPSLAVPLYLGFAAAQWMSSPGLYNLLMSRTPEHERSSAAALTMFCNALVSSFATAIAGSLFARFGYPPVLSGIAAFATTVAILCGFLLSTHRTTVQA